MKRFSNIKLKNKSFWEGMLHTFAFLIFPILLFYLMEGFEHNAFVEVRPTAQLYNILLFELIAWSLFFVTGSGRLALQIETGMAFLYGLVNHYVLAFRSTPFVPWDIFSIETAASVAGNYDFTPTAEMVIILIAFLMAFLATFLIKFKFAFKIQYRILLGLCVTGLLCGFTSLLWNDNFQTNSSLYPHLFTPTYMTKVNGMAVTFAMNLEYVGVEKPDGYSKEYALSILKEYEEKKDSDGLLKKEDYPNVIVIMNEAFSDLSVLGDFTTNEDYMPFIHSLQSGAENTITGTLKVSVCGGNTANSEFEFLTGHSMDYLPMGSIPYQQYIKSDLPSLASQLKAMGYTTYGMHPYNASGWKRNEIYPMLGFSESFFLNDFTNRYYLRKYVSDNSAYNKIIELYEEKEEGSPLFFFEVTMQNHGGYSELFDNFVPDIDVIESENVALEQYLSLVKESDQALKELINYFKYVDENTIIVFFGDHQPNDYVANQILRLNGIEPSEMTAAEMDLRYQVPYVIWANYDIKEASKENIDISYLSAMLMQEAGLKTNAYQNFLLDMKEALESNADSKEAKEFIEKHKILQYYFMFDY